VESQGAPCVRWRAARVEVHMATPRLRLARPVLVLLVLPALLACAGSTQSPGTHPISGRRIADVMSHRGAAWLDRAERDREENTTRAVESLGLEPGMVVADFGAGSGYYTERIARKVGPGGRVLAVDIQPEMLEMLGRRIERQQLRNVELVRSTVDDPRLPQGQVDLVVMVDVYHELAEPQLMLRRLAASLSPRGRIALLEYRKEDPSVPIREEHKMSVAQAVQEFGAEGYVLDARVDSLPWQHLLFFRPDPRADVP
jgi:ubiquinone/menaquinone biosynthesis C-methylase UbiE